ncbi:hypothetical protein DFA_09770 [Cavenderia fasciculata]|uniref:Uncharacterized protein n=1 Tax=Cavenderia fasciculata TaxID=261658 RepID=F4Q8J8_CACFS|nr:uncharacterized protein DFA_09770 [Cavenderia fasciculata]EGG16098.1 hypothetical protein DFA_09770 [Cavenderia fasciculata]|eukprot:XP_004352423.1 hypothetical protein DFA_09770 [Cavenderia fasciculata]
MNKEEGLIPKFIQLKLIQLLDCQKLFYNYCVVTKELQFGSFSFKPIDQYINNRSQQLKSKTNQTYSIVDEEEEEEEEEEEDFIVKQHKNNNNVLGYALVSKYWFRMVQREVSRLLVISGNNCPFGSYECIPDIDSFLIDKSMFYRAFDWLKIERPNHIVNVEMVSHLVIVESMDFVVNAKDWTPLFISLQQITVACSPSSMLGFIKSKTIEQWKNMSLGVDFILDNRSFSDRFFLQNKVDQDIRQVILDGVQGIENWINFLHITKIDICLASHKAHQEYGNAFKNISTLESLCIRNDYVDIGDVNQILCIPTINTLHIEMPFHFISSCALGATFHSGCRLSYKISDHRTDRNQLILDIELFCKLIRENKTITSLMVQDVCRRNHDHFQSVYTSSQQIHQTFDNIQYRCNNRAILPITCNCKYLLFGNFLSPRSFWPITRNPVL